MTPATKPRYPLEILEYRVTGNEFIVVGPAAYGHGIDGWRICGEHSSLTTARSDAANEPGSRIYQRWGNTFKRVAKR